MNNSAFQHLRGVFLHDGIPNIIKILLNILVISGTSEVGEEIACMNMSRINT